MSEFRRRAWATFAVSAAVGALAAGTASGKDSKENLQRDLRDNVVVGDWIYDDIDAGFARAVREKKPVCVVFR